MGFWGIIGAGWRGTLGAARANLPVFGLMFGIGAVVINVGDFIVPMHFVRETLSAGHAVIIPNFSPLYSIKTIIVDTLVCVIVAPCMIAVHRHILLDEDSKVWANMQRLGRFALLVFLVRFPFSILPQILRLLPGNWVPLIEISMMAGVVFVFLFALAYPAMALDLPKPVEVGTGVSKGQIGNIAATLSLGLLPLYFVYLLIAAIIYEIAHTWPEAETLIEGVGNTLNALAVIVTGSVAAGLASELFRKYGSIPLQA
jgi:hypothetical protein